MFNQQSKFINGWRFPVFLFVVVFIVRLPSLFVGFYNPDETYYATFGQRLLEGGLLYSNIVDHKPPLVYYIHSFFALIGGQNAIVVAHAAIILIITATAAVIYSIVRRISDHQTLCAGASLLYVLGSSLGKPNDVAAAGSEFMFNLPLALHILFIIKSLEAEDGKKYIFTCASGIVAGIAILIKQQAAIIPVVATPIYLLYAYLRTQTSLKNIIVYLVSLSLPLLATALWLYQLGLLQAAWYWAVAVNSLYVHGNEKGVWLLARFAKQTLYMLLAEESAIWLPIAFWIAIRKRGEGLFERHGTLITLWLLFSTVAIFPGGRFFGHYYLQMLPAACIMGAAAGFRLIQNQPIPKKILKIIWVFLIIIPLIHSWIWSLPIKSFRGELEIEEFAKVIDYLKNNSQPNEQIDVWGKFNGIPFLVGRKNGTRFLGKHMLSGSFRGEYLVKMPDSHWEMYFSDLEKNRPEWFVDISLTSMPYAPISLFPRLSDYVEKNYALTAEIEGYRIYRHK